VTFAASVAARRCCGRKGRGRHRTGIAVTFRQVPPLSARRVARGEAWAGVLLVGR